VTIAMAMEQIDAGRPEMLTRGQFEVFYGRTAPTLRSYISRVAANPSIVDDILQESYIRMLSAPPMLDGPRKSYLYRTATNLITDYYRAQSRQRHWWQLTARRAEAVDSTTELSSDMERLFAQVSEQERALLWLAYVEGEGHREIAEILGLKEKSVKVLLFRARRKMEVILTRHGFGASHE
jgi:RNA polymerase sigma-70 factor (ECF subfamily)